MARAARPRIDADRADRTERIRTFTYGPRHRWAYAPTAGFLIVVFGILAIRPELLWPTVVDEQVRRAALLLSGGLGAGFVIALVLRWTEPQTVRLEPDALVAVPLLGRLTRAPYGEIVSVVERPPSFMRGYVELEIRTGHRRPLFVRGDIREYAHLVRLLRTWVPADVRSNWKEEARRPQ